MNYNPKDYWEKRLSNGFNLSRVGTLGFNEYYNSFLYKAKTRALKKALLFRRIDIHNKKVCDLGCGTGFFIEFYKSKGAREITGVDITNISVDSNKLKYPELSFINGDISSSSLISLINRKFDIVNAFDVLYHIKDDKAFTQAIANISILTEDNGYILFTDLCDSKNIDLARHVTLRSRKNYETEFWKNNVRIIAVYPMCYLMDRPILGAINIKSLRNIGNKLDNMFAPFYYCIDRFLLSSNRNNNNLVIAKKITRNIDG